MIYLIKSHVTGNLSVSDPIIDIIEDPIIEDAIRFVKELQIVKELQKTSKGTYT